MMQQINHINFIDVESQDEAFVLVRAGAGIVGLTLPLKEDGDIEVFLGLSECEQLLLSLQKAVSVAKGVALAA